MHSSKPTIDAETRESWQRIVNLLAKTFGLQAVTIMRSNSESFEVYQSSETHGNPFSIGGRYGLDGSTLCERVLKSGESVEVLDVSRDSCFRGSRAEEAGIVYYSGHPLFWPDGELFGSICQFDMKANDVASSNQALAEEFRDVIERDLARAVEAEERRGLADELQRSYDKLEQKVAEQTRELAASEEKYRLIFDSVSEAIFLLDGMKPVFVNQTAIEMFGYGSFDEMQQLSPADASPEYQPNGRKSREWQEELYGRALAGECPRFRWVHFHKDGHEIVADVTLSSVELDGERYVLSVLRDIAEQVKMEAALLLSEEKYRGIFENATDGILLMSGFEVTACNQKAADIFGLDNPGEVIGRTPVDFSPEFQPNGASSKQKAKEMVGLALEGKTQRFRWNHVRPDGEEIEVEVQLNAMNSLGEESVLAIVRDMSEQRRVENALFKSEERYSLAQDCANIGSWDWDVKTGKVGWSRQVADIFGFESESFDGTYESFMELVHPEDRRKIEEAIQYCMEYAERYSVEHRLVLRDGTVRWLLETGDARRNSNGDVDRVMGIVQDITRRKEVEFEREKLLSLLASKTEELEGIIYASSHDLKSPLVNIQGFSGELEKACERLTELMRGRERFSEADKEIDHIIEDEIPMFLRFIQGSGEKMDQLQNGLLRLCRLGRVEFKMDVLNMDSLVHRVVLGLNYKLRDEGVIVDVGKLPSCIGDEHAVEQVMMNLIDNAIKYKKSGQEGLVQISGYVEGERVVYCVSDNGIGLSAQHKENIFEIFHRLNPTSNVTGEGLGLTIVRRIVSRLGGEAWAESEEEVGSRFYVSLPCGERVRKLMGPHDTNL